MGISLYFKSYYKKGMITLHHAFAFNMVESRGLEPMTPCL
jgi:hypothetical protein